MSVVDSSIDEFPIRRSDEHMSAHLDEEDLLRRAYKAHFRACTREQYYWQPNSIGSGLCEHCGKHYVLLDGYTKRVYRVLNNGKLKQLERWPRAIED